jgi:hypothetical protein
MQGSFAHTVRPPFTVSEKSIIQRKAAVYMAWGAASPERAAVVLV